MKKPVSILIVEDDDDMRVACTYVLTHHGYSVEHASNGTDAIDLLGGRAFDLVLLDVMMPGPNGLEILSWLRSESPDTPAIITTGYATLDMAVEAMRTGAADFLAKPFTPDEIIRSVERALQTHRIERENVLLRQELAARADLKGFVGRGEAMRQVRELIDRVGPSNSALLITGEPGTGKEMVARKIWETSPRRDKPFIVVECGALLGTPFESELFGYVKSAIPGAQSARHGRLDVASEGTLFFDEVASLSLDVQGRLLGVMEGRGFTRLGGARVIPADVRVLAATSRNMAEEIAAGRFREDLYYRLAVVPIDLPPLRQRTEDVPLFAQSFLAKYNRKCRKRIAGFSADAMAALVRHDWPGNVRELDNVVERAVVLANADVIDLKDLMWLGPDAAAGRATGEMDLRDMEREYVARVLKECDGNRSATARRLGIDRKTLWRKLKDAS
ncbi:MAG: sigma-54 dependent transcriptional regulator [Deltaproteobacteria bacterium]|nr:sigma-54 dependent transcriptional regulator [Deltaproteobacteria bacterium]